MITQLSKKVLLVLSIFIIIQLHATTANAEEWIDKSEDPIIEQEIVEEQEEEPIEEEVVEQEDLHKDNLVDESIEESDTQVDKEIDQNQRLNTLEKKNDLDEQNIDENIEIEIQLASSYGPPYKSGDENPGVTELKKKLKRLGIGNYPENPSQKYGGSTKRNVMKFQSYYGLEETGVADQSTLDKIDEILLSDYQNGRNGNHVVTLKKNLRLLGIGNYPANPSPKFGGSTERNVRKFQSTYGLLVNGIADSVTLAKIDELVGVIQLKKNLSRLGIGNYPKNPSPRYGNSTKRNVKTFQSYYGLEVTGIADESTLEKLDEILSSDYQNGRSGDHVVTLKKNLSLLGIGNYPTSPSQKFGGSTERNIRKFQSTYGLLVHGIADSVTLAKIDELVGVIQLKKNLSRLGIGNYPEIPSSRYGSSTKRNVKTFQSYYGLEATGIADQATLEKIAAIISSEYQDGKRGDHVVELKKNLKRLGFGNYPDNPSPRYGDSTDRNVRAFQEYYGLRVNGIADEVTLKKINEVLSSPYRKGQSGDHIVKLKKDLRSLGIGNYPANPSPDFGASTEKNVKEFQEKYDLRVSGIADEVTLAKIEEVLSGRLITFYDITLAEAVEIQMRVNPKTDKKYAWVSADYIKNNKVTVKTRLNVRTEPNTSSDNNIIGTLEDGTEVKILAEYDNWYVIEYNSSEWVRAMEKDVLYYLDPRNFIYDKMGQFQFLDLSKTSGAKVSVLNKYLEERGILKGHGETFIKAGRRHGVNEVYLISHAVLETGNGTSDLATGSIKVGELGANKWVSIQKNGTYIAELNGKEWKIEKVNNFNVKQAKNVEVIYNMFGIGAYDGNALTLGSIRAYREGWFTPEDAIIGGAKFIGNGYIQSGQNTLYKMRWNPKAMETEGIATHQYATDIGWAQKQVRNIYNLYQELGIKNYILEIPQYK